MHVLINTIEKLWSHLKKQLVKDADAMFGLRYKVWVINTKSDVSLYTWENWKQLYPIINSLLELVNQQAAIRTFQSFDKENSWLGFGRMNWSEENNRKWTSKYRTEEYVKKNLQFHNTEISTPDWNQCQRTNTRPEMFIKIYHADFQNLKEGILIAIPKRMITENNELINSSILSIQKLIPGATLSCIERYWAPGRNFQNNLEDINPHELSHIVSGDYKYKMMCFL